MKFASLSRLRSCLKRVTLGKPFSVILGKLGYHVGTHPCVFFLLPLAVTLVLSTGIQKLNYVDDAELLFSPRNGRSKLERDLVERHFHVDQSGSFSATRLTRSCRMGRVVVTPNDAGSVLRAEIFSEIAQIDSVIRNMSVTIKNRLLRYKDVCAHWRNRCSDNSILLLRNYMESIENGSVKLTYPVTLDRDSFDLIFIPAHLGGVSVTDNRVTRASALMLGYYVTSAEPQDDVIGALWEEELEKTLRNLRPRLRNVTLHFMTSVTLHKELDANFNEGMPYLSISLALMLAFTAVSCVTFDWVRCKAWLGMMGVMCTALGITSAFGLLIYAGVEFTGMNFAVPFLALGIGLDDTFMMISCWRQTSPRDQVNQRLKQTLEKAGISITITSATDFVSFWIGMITPFEAVRIFCIYIATSILFVYLCHVTMFAACMAFAGQLERNQRHGLVFVRVDTRKQATQDGRGWLYRVFCTGGDVSSDDSGSQHIRLKRVSQWLANTLNLFWVKVGVAVAFSCYLGVSVWGITVLGEGLDMVKLCRYRSDAANFFQLQSSNFQQYRVQVIVEGKLNYSQPEVQSRLDSMLTLFESSEHMGGRMLTESWLRAYRTYAELAQLNTSTEEEFTRSVHNFVNNSSFELDIDFDDDRKSIVASRFLIQTQDVADGQAGTKMMQQLRALTTTFPFNVTVFNPFFVYFDQFTLVRPYTMQCVLVASVVMLTVAILFLPDLLCACSIGVAILSLGVGIVGLMSLWGMKLDAITMINLILCIGFSVDFSAHVAHAFLTAPAHHQVEWTQHAFDTAALPVLQGAFSTILALTPLLLVHSYIAEAFFKIIFLVTVLGALHALVLLPVLLSTLHSLQKTPEVTSSAPLVITISLSVEKPEAEAGPDMTDQGLGTSCTDDSSDSSRKSTPKIFHFASGKANLSVEHTCKRHLSYKARMAAHKANGREASGGYDTDIEDDGTS